MVPLFSLSAIDQVSDIERQTRRGNNYSIMQIKITDETSCTPSSTATSTAEECLYHTLLTNAIVVLLCEKWVGVQREILG